MKNVWKSLSILIGIIMILTACAKSADQQAAQQLELGQRYLTEGKYEEAIVAFSKVIELDPNEIQAYTGIITAYMESGKSDEAEAMIEICLNHFEQTDVPVDETYWGDFLRVAETYYESQDDPQASLSYWERIISMEPMNETHKESAEYYRIELIEKYLQLGREYLEKETYKEAVEAFEKVLELDPENIEAYLLMADIYEKTGEDEKAREILECGYEITQDELIKEAQEEHQEDTPEVSGERERIGKLAEEEGWEVFYPDTTEEFEEILRKHKSNIYIVLDAKDYVMEISFNGCENVTVHGMDGTRIVSDSGSDTIINISSCKNITLINLVLGHDIPTAENELYDCTCGVVWVYGGSEVTFINCDIFGCGLCGIDAGNSTITARNSTIRDCSDYIMSLYNSNGLFENCNFLRNGYMYPWRNAISIGSTSSLETTLTLSECIFSGNGNPQCIGTTEGAVNYNIDNCTFFGNVWGEDNVSSEPEPYGKMINQ